MFSSKTNHQTPDKIREEVLMQAAHGSSKRVRLILSCLVGWRMR